MSQYLSKYFCGNKTGLCNYDEPLEYSKLLDRQFDNKILKIREDCSVNQGILGYCCDESKTDIMNEETMKRINKEYNEEVFTKNNLGNFHKGQIPLVKVNKNKNGDIDNIELCTCGGEAKDYNYCVKHDCKGFRMPTEYEYCKLGSEHNKIGCFLNTKFQDLEYLHNNNNNKNQNNNNQNNNSQNNNLNNNNNNEIDLLDRCKLHMVNKKNSSIEKTTLKVNNLQDDCFKKVCMKDDNLKKLRNMINSTTTDENKYFNLLGDSSMSYRYLQPKEIIDNRKKVSNESIEDLLRN